MDIYKKISEASSFREGLISELVAAGDVLHSWEEADCDYCGDCPSCDAYDSVNWDELSLFFNVDDDVRAVSFFNEPLYVDGAVSFFDKAKEVEEMGELEFASFLIGVPGLFHFLDNNYFDGLDGVEMDALLDAVADVVKGGTVDEAEVFFGGVFWYENFWLREYFYTRGGDAVRWARLEEEVGKAREELFYDAEAVEKFSLDALLAEVYTYDDPDNLYSESPVGEWGNLWEEVQIGNSFYTVDLELSGRDYPFKFSPDALHSLASLSGNPAGVVEGLMDGAGFTVDDAHKVWPWFYSINALWDLIEGAFIDGGIGGSFVRKAFGEAFIEERMKWVYRVMVDWIRNHRVFWGTREENSVLLQAAKSPHLDEEGAGLIVDALPGYWNSPDVYIALAGNSHAPLRLLEDFASDNLDLGVPELEELARDAIAKKGKAAGE